MRAGGLPAPIAQYEVTARGRFVAPVDSAWPELRLAVEYDGEWHAQPGQLARDRRRLNRLTATGWRVLFLTAADLHRPEGLIAAAAGNTRTGRRSCTEDICAQAQRLPWRRGRLPPGTPHLGGARRS